LALWLLTLELILEEVEKVPVHCSYKKKQRYY